MFPYTRKSTDKIYILVGLNFAGQSDLNYRYFIFIYFTIQNIRYHVHLQLDYCLVNLLGAIEKLVGHLGFLNKFSVLLPILHLHRIPIGGSKKLG